MEGICKASILDNPVTVTLAHFEQNLPLVTLKDIAPVLQVVKVPAFDLSTLQSCLYYIILVEQGVQERVADLKRCCIGQLSEKYIEQGMQFPILEYAQLCSRILSIKLEECLCLLFFMIYGRMASRQYVRFLMHRQPRKQLFRKQVKSVSLRTQSGSSLPVQQERIHLEQQVFMRQLKETLYPRQTDNMKTELAGSRIRLDPRRVVHRANVRERKLENKENEQECSKGGKRIKVSNVWLPSKVGVAENSSIIGLAILNEDLHSQVAYQKMLQQKLRMRKQRFDDNYDVAEAINKWKAHPTKPSYKENFGVDYRKRVFPKAGKRAQSYKNLVKQIKTVNNQLEEIRVHCNLSKCREQLREDKWSYQSNSFLDKGCIFGRDDFGRDDFGNGKQLRESFANSSGNLQFHQTERVLTQQTVKLYDQIVSLPVREAILARKSLSGQVGKLTKPSMESPQSASNQKQSSWSGEQPWPRQRQHPKETKQQKYKKQYKQFLKTQLFERIRVSGS